MGVGRGLGRGCHRAQPPGAVSTGAAKALPARSGGCFGAPGTIIPFPAERLVRAATCERAARHADRPRQPRKGCSRVFRPKALTLATTRWPPASPPRKIGANRACAPAAAASRLTGLASLAKYSPLGGPLAKRLPLHHVPDFAHLVPSPGRDSNRNRRPGAPQTSGQG